MARGNWSRRGQRVVESATWRVVFNTLLTATLLCGVSAAANTDPADVERLVRAAHEAALSGQPAQHFALLRQAVEAAPNFELARWQLGQIQVDDEWLTVEEAQRRAAANPKYAQYREMRKTYGETAEGQLALARWCRRNELGEESLFHWANVLVLQPNHEEALRAVGRRWYNGQLLTADEIDETRAAAKAADRAARRWTASLHKWERALSGNSDLSREDALEEIRSLDSVEAIPVMEERTLNTGRMNSRAVELQRDLSLALLSALENMSEHAATESLVRHAVLSPLSDIRAQATYQLERRPLHDYVPLLLSGLAMPIESWFQVRTSPDGSVHYRHNLYRVGATADWSMEASHANWQHVVVNRDPEQERDGVVTEREIQRDIGTLRRLSRNAATSQRRFAIQAMTVENEVARENIATLMRNDRIIPVLAQTTGENFGDEPKEWWDWWQNYNEYYAPDDRPVYERRHVQVNHYFVPEGTMMSCFAKGTPVWTKTGVVPIETLEMGDLVLSQDADTGELAYKPIIGRTVRPPSKILRIRVGEHEINTTLGHPFWVAGVGWRMAKELDDGAVMHAVTGGPMVNGVEEAGEAEAYNLVVADFNTYFVGEAGLLVHDNTPRKPTRVVVPGLAAK